MFSHLLIVSLLVSIGTVLCFMPCQIAAILFDLMPKYTLKMFSCRFKKDILFITALHLTLGHFSGCSH
jgi:hypothetical protein